MSVEYVEQRPAPGLAKHVEALWWMRRSTPDPPRPPDRVLPDGCVELVLHLRDAFAAGSDPDTFSV